MERPIAARSKGFTLIELMVVMAVLALLATLVAPRVIGHVARAKEETLQHNLQAIRQAIDRHYSDTGRYPLTLDELVSKRYLRKAPVDPVTGRTDSWKLVPPKDGAGIADVQSGAGDNGQDGTPYASW